MGESPKPSVSQPNNVDSEEAAEAPQQEKLDFVAQVRDLLNRCAPDKVALPILERLKTHHTKEQMTHEELIVASNTITGILAEFRRKGTNPDSFPPRFGYKLDEPIVFIGLDPKGALRVSNEKVMMGYSPKEIADRLTAFLDTGVIPQIKVRSHAEQPLGADAQGQWGEPDPDWYYEYFRYAQAQAHANERARQERAERRAHFLRVISDIQSATSVEALRDIVYQNEFVVRSNDVGERSPFDMRDVRPGSTGRYATNRNQEWSWEASERGVTLWMQRLDQLGEHEQTFRNLIALHQEARDFFEAMWASETSAYGRAVTNKIELMFIKSLDEQIKIAGQERWSKRELAAKISEPFRELFYPLSAGKRHWWTDIVSTRKYHDALQKLNVAQEKAPIINIKRAFRRSE